MPQSRFHHGKGTQATLGKQILGQGAAIDADADGNIPLGCGFHHRFHIFPGAYIAGNTHRMRSTITAASTAAHETAMRMPETVLLPIPSTIERTCRPISRNTAFSRT